MSPLTVIRVAIRALLRYKLRSLLTMLGVVMGVATLITVLAIAAGARRAMEEQMAKMGSNMLYIWGGSSNRGGVRGARGSGNGLTVEDLLDARAQCKSIRAVSPVVWASGQVIFGNENCNTMVVGVGEDYSIIRGWPLGKGAFFDEEAVHSAARVCVVGSKVAHDLFGAEEPLGATVRIENMPFRVIGVLSEKGDRFWGGDDSVLIPYRTAMRQVRQRTKIHSAVASAVSFDAVDRAKVEMAALIRQRHKLRNDEDDDFDIHSQVQWAREQAEASAVLTALLAGVASVSLLVGGIGIMNIMLVSVSERVREIGIRMAVGARARDVRIQFLVEALILSAVGGMVGVGVGWEMSDVVARYGTWETLVSPESIAVALGFSMTVGIFFGFYPASKASRLDPVIALQED